MKEKKMKMPHQTATVLLLLLLLTATTILAKPEGVYHQEYQYKQSSASYKNSELQHKNDDEGFYTKDGDLTGARDPTVNEQHEHRAFINPKLRAQGYSTQDFGRGAADVFSHAGRAQRFLGENAPSLGAGYSSAYNTQKPYGSTAGGTTLSAGMRSFMTDLQYDMQRQLEHQLQQWRQDQEEYSGAHAHNTEQRHASTSSGLYSPNTASVDTMRRELQQEIRVNLTREIDLRNRIAHYDSADLADIKRRLQENLMRQLNELMRAQQTGQPLDYQTYSTRGAVNTKSASSAHQMNYSVVPSVTVPSADTQLYASYEQDDLNKQQRYNQERANTMVPTAQSQYAPSVAPSYGSSSYGSSSYGSASRTGSQYDGQVNPAPIVRNVNEITEIAQQVQNDMQQVLIKALDQYQRENNFIPSNNYQTTKPDYTYARQDFESRLQYNLTEHFQTILDRHFGAQDQRGQYYFSRGGGGGGDEQRYANYKRDDYERLKQQVQENLRQYLRDSLKTQQDSYETQQRAYTAASGSSAATYTASGQQNQPSYRKDYYARPSDLGEQASRSYSSSSSYSGSAAYQTKSRPQRTGTTHTKAYYPPPSGYRTTSDDSTAYGTFAKYQGESSGSSQYASSMIGGQSGVAEDCDENMQGDDPNAYFNQRGRSASSLAALGAQTTPSVGNLAYYRQRPYSYSEALTKPGDINDDFQRPVSSMEDYQRPISSMEDYQRPISSMEDYQRPVSNNEDYQRLVSSMEDHQRPISNNEDYQRPVSSMEDNQKPVSELQDFQRPVELLDTYRKPSSGLYNSESSNYGTNRYLSTRPNTIHTNFHQNVQLSVNNADYDDDIQQRVSPLSGDHRIDVEINSAAAKTKLLGNNVDGNLGQRPEVLLKPLLERPVPNLDNNLIPNGFTTSTTARNESNDRIDEIAQKLRDSVSEEFHNAQQKTLANDDEDFFDLDPFSSSPSKFDDFSGTTEAKFAKQNEDLLRIVRPQTYDKPYSVDVISSTPEYDTQTKPVKLFELNFVEKTTPLYNSDIRQPVYYMGNSRFYNKPATTEAPKIVGHDADMSQQHLADSYEDFQPHENPLYIKPKLNQFTQNQVEENQRYGVNSQQVKSAQPNLENKKPIQANPKKYPEDEEFLDNILRLPKAIDEDDEEIEDFEQRPVDDNQEVISSHRGDIDSFSKVNIDRQQNRDLPVRLVDITGQRNDPVLIQPPDDFFQHSDDFQRPEEGLDDPPQRPVDDEYDDYDHDINRLYARHPRPMQRERGHLIQQGQRLPEAYGRVAQAPRVELFENVHRQEVRPLYLSSDYNVEESALDSLHNSTETPGFWRKVGGKISVTYNNAKQKARNLVEKINLL